MKKKIPTAKSVGIFAIRRLERLLGAGDDIVLSLTGEHIEECAVAGNTDDQITVLLRVCLSIQQSGSVHNIVLNVIAFQAVKEGADHQLQLLDIFLGGQQRGGDFLIQQHTAGDLMGGQLGNGFEYRGGALLVHSMGGRTTLSQRLTGMTAVGCCHGAVALTDVSGNGGGTGIADAADGTTAETGVGILLHLVDLRLVGLDHQQVSGIVIVAVLGCFVDQLLTDGFAFLTGKVSCQSFHQLLLGDLFPVEYQCLNGS